MIQIENIAVFGCEAAIRGMRNPLGSWQQSDSKFDNGNASIGAHDLDLMRRLVAAGTDHRKFMRYIGVTCDVTAPLYWWKEFDTYKVGTVANSCSTMHRIHSKNIGINDFSHEHLTGTSAAILLDLIDVMNRYRNMYLTYKDKEYWWQLIQLLPASYNQRRTVQLNYEVLRNIYSARKAHKLDEWHDFCAMIQQLPHSELITA